MIVGTVKEIKNHEYRVGLTPEGVAELVAHGHTLLVEQSAGLGIVRPTRIMPPLARKSLRRRQRFSSART